MAQKHLIHRQVYEITVDRHSGAAALQTRVSELHHRELSHLLSETLDEMVPENQYLQIDRLELDFGNLEKTDWQVKIAEELRKVLRREVRSASASSVKPVSFGKAASGESEGQPRMIQFSSEAEKKQELLFYFLVNGRLPWWWKSEDKPDFNSILQQLLEAKKELDFQRFREVLVVAPERSTQRLVEHFSKARIQKIIRLLFLAEAQTQVFKASIKFLLAVAKKAAVAETRLIRTYHRELLLSLSSRPSGKKWAGKELETEVLPKALKAAMTILIPPSKIREIDFEQDVKIEVAPKEFDSLLASLRKQLSREETQSASAKKAWQDTPTKKEPGPPFFTEEEETGVPVSNAGAVLLYPYLKQFFGQEKLLDAKNQFRNEDSQVQAIHLLQYLCGGAKAEAEYELTLNKLLCGRELEEPLPIDFEIGQETKERITGLLQSAVKNWSALKSTSPDGLRRAFLQREGLLYNGDRILIRIERQTQDVLLDRLPYTLSIFKLPWLEHMIHVEW